MPFLKVKYFLCATLDRLEGQKPLRYKSSLMVHEKPDPQPLKDLKQMDAESITTWCCCSQGTSRMNVEFNGQTFTPDDTAVATIKIDNSKCKLRCTKVTLEFWMSMLMESSNGEVFTMEKVLQDETTEGPMPGDGSWEKTMDIELAKIMFEVVTEKVNLSSKSVTLSLEDQYMVQRL